MANEFFKNILNFGRKEDTCSSEVQQQTTNNTEVKAERIDYIAMQQAIIEGVVANIHGMELQFGTKMEDYTLILYINEIMLFQSCQNDHFRMELTERLLMDCNYSFAEIEVKEGVPPTDMASRKVTDKTSICLKNGRPTIGRQARLSALEGSLVTDEVKLDSESIDKLPGKRMNVGIGKKVKLRSGVIRINHIAIDDDPQSENFDLNKYVSRAHAYIDYNRNEGFVLTVEVGGTPTGQHRTMVYRGNQEIRMDIPNMRVPLVNGDQIILSRTVTLLFEILNND